MGSERDERPGALVWTLPEPPGRPTTTLSRAKVLAAGLAVADAEGAAALTMRRVATELGSSTPMSLYRYVGSKDGLVDLMLDAVYGEIELPEPSGDWRADLESLALNTWAVIKRHLWFGELSYTRPPFGPNALRYLDFRVALLRPLGADADTIARIAAAVDGHLVGAAMGAAEEQRMRRRTGLHTEEQLRTAAAPFLAEIFAEGRYPAFAEWVREHDPAALSDNVEFTLGCLLDGLALRLTAPRQPPARAT